MERLNDEAASFQVVMLLYFEQKRLFKHKQSCYDYIWDFRHIWHTANEK